jgi:hypothetical protein
MSYAEVLPPAALSKSGRFIRVALVVFPLGTILLGIASFGIWMWKKDRVEDRNLRHASALRQVPTSAGRDKHREVLTAVSAGSYEDRLASTASYLESSLGAEGMGYDPQRFVVALDKGLPVAGVMAELTGKQRPREIVLVLLSYGNAAMVVRENESLASLLTLANWMTGEPVVRTLRFVALPLAGMSERERREVLVRFGEEMRRKEERVLHLVDASAEVSGLGETTREALEMAARGVVVRRVEWPRTVDEGTGSYGGLRELLLGLAETP